MRLVGHSGMLIHSAIRATALQTLTTNRFTKKGIHLFKSTLQIHCLKPKTLMEFRCIFCVERAVLKPHRFLSAVHSERRDEAPGALRAEIMLNRVQVFFLRLNVPENLGFL